MVFLNQTYVMPRAVYEYTFGCCTGQEEMALCDLWIRGNRIWRSILLRRRYYWFNQGCLDDVSIDCIASCEEERLALKADAR